MRKRILMRTEGPWKRISYWNKCILQQWDEGDKTCDNQLWTRVTNEWRILDLNIEENDRRNWLSSSQKWKVMPKNYKPRKSDHQRICVISPTRLRIAGLNTSMTYLVSITMWTTKPNKENRYKNSWSCNYNIILVYIQDLWWLEVHI